MKTRRLIVPMMLAGLMNMAVFADAPAAPASNPASAPPVATVPAPVVVTQANHANAAAQVNVLVLPFQFINSENTHTWIGLALQQSLASAVAREHALHAIANTNLPATVDVDVALKAAKLANAPVVVFGNYQMVDENLRVTGYMMDNSGRVVSVFQATDPVHSLFSLEDRLNQQLLAALSMQFPALAPSIPAAETSAASPQPVVSAPVGTATTPVAAGPGYNYNALPPMVYVTPENAASAPIYQSYPYPYVAPSAPVAYAPELSGADLYSSDISGDFYSYPTYSYPNVYGAYGIYPYTSVGFGFGGGFGGGFFHGGVGHGFGGHGGFGKGGGMMGGHGGRR